MFFMKANGGNKQNNDLATGVSANPRSKAARTESRPEASCASGTKGQGLSKGGSPESVGSHL